MIDGQEAGLYRKACGTRRSAEVESSRHSSVLPRQNLRLDACESPRALGRQDRDRRVSRQRPQLRPRDGDVCRAVFRPERTGLRCPEGSGGEWSRGRPNGRMTIGELPESGRDDHPRGDGKTSSGFGFHDRCQGCGAQPPERPQRQPGRCRGTRIEPHRPAAASQRQRVSRVGRRERWGGRRPRPWTGQGGRRRSRPWRRPRSGW